MKTFEKPEVKVSEFKVEDVVTTSYQYPEQGDNDTPFLPNN